MNSTDRTYHTTSWCIDNETSTLHLDGEWYNLEIITHIMASGGIPKGPIDIYLDKDFEAIDLRLCIKHFYEFKSIKVHPENKYYMEHDGLVLTKDGKKLIIASRDVVDVVVPDGVEVIGVSAFFGNQTLRSVVLPDSVKQIMLYAFKGCLNIKSFKVPKECDTDCIDMPNVKWILDDFEKRMK